ncbi:MAG: ABC transporter permease subunit [Neisseriaceae bacterium]|nr:ABC transporter permease subunit [Neisseriaceae bacterium]
MSFLVKNKQIFREIIFFLIFCNFSVFILADEMSQDEKLTVGIDLTYAPYAYLDDGQPSGFDPDFMELIAKNMGLSVEFKDTRIENIILGLNSNYYDVVASALYIDSQRSKQVDFLPYLQTGGVLVVRKDDQYSPQHLEDLCGKSVSSMKGASWIPKIQQISRDYCSPNKLDSIVIKEYPSAPEASQALLSRGVDVQYEDAAVAQMVINQLGNQLKITNKQQLSPVLIGLAFNKSNTKMKSIVAKTMLDLKKSGQYDALLDKYNLKFPSSELLESNHLTGVLEKSAAEIDQSESYKKIDSRFIKKDFNWKYLGSLLYSFYFWNAVITVLKLSTLTWICAVFWGFILALGNQSKYILLKYFSNFYVWFFRSLPLLVLLIFIYNIPQFWMGSSVILSNSFITGLIALTLSESAYISEIHRGALQAIPEGQYEAGKALGIGFGGIQKKIIIPQALRISLPPLTNQYVTIIKLTSLVSVISLTQILLVGQQLYTRNFLVIETLMAVAFYYVLIVSLITWLLKYIENYLDISFKKDILFQGKITTDPDILDEYRKIKVEKRDGIYALNIRNAYKDFSEISILKKINLDVKWGEILSIIGPSGSGKTTLIRSINGLEPLDSGQILFDGRLFVEGKKLSSDAQKLIIHLGMVFQNYNLFPHKTVLQDLMLAPEYHGKSRQETKLLALSMLDKVGLLNQVYKYPHQLSGGQQQRVAIARALVMQPSIILFDEPTAALAKVAVNHRH